ncbi:MAG: hypothetical protein HQM10_06250 [Candidatus Riflebacteria bacterium]|nr:hypothetical protein [Candidatus Riflebacteria bacterium]
MEIQSYVKLDITKPEKSVISNYEKVSIPEKVPGDPLATIRNARESKMAALISKEPFSEIQNVLREANMLEETAKAEYLRKKMADMDVYGEDGKRANQINASILNYLV